MYDFVGMFGKRGEAHRNGLLQPRIRVLWLLRDIRCHSMPTRNDKLYEFKLSTIVETFGDALDKMSTVSAWKK
jgi:hypothetical protein